MTYLGFLEIFRPILHYGCHLVVPILISIIFFRKIWKKAYLIMLATMLVDLDHLLAKPMFDPQRCSIGFHPLHSYYAIAVYFIMVFFPKYRIIAIGLIFHMFTDYQDFLLLKYINYLS